LAKIKIENLEKLSKSKGEILIELLEYSNALSGSKFLRKPRRIVIGEENLFALGHASFNSPKTIFLNPNQGEKSLVETYFHELGHIRFRTFSEEKADKFMVEQLPLFHSHLAKKSQMTK